MIFLVFIVAVLVFAGLLILSSSQNTSAQALNKRGKTMRKLYKFFSNFFLTQLHIASIYRRLANLSVYKRDELQVMSVKLLFVAWGIGLGISIVSFLLFNDFLTTLIVILFAILVANIAVDKQLDRASFKVVKALSVALSAIRQEYLNLNNVVEALNSADIPNVVRRPIEEIAAILVDTDSELKLQEFIEASPYRTIQTLAGVCYSINNQGDERDEHGQSAFIMALSLMLSDTNAAIQKTVYRQKRFGFIEYLPFFPILGIGLIESYFTSIMPGTALVYDGPLGYIMQVLTVVVSILAYLIISRVNMSVPIKEDDRSSYILALLDRPAFAQFIRNIVPKNTSRRRLEKRLHAALSRMSVEHLYSKKVISAVLATALAFLSLYSAVSLGRDFLLTSTQQLSLIATTASTPQEVQEIRSMDKVFLANPAAYSNPNALSSLVTSYMPGLSSFAVQGQEQRLLNKASALQSAYFQWWFIWIVIFTGLLGWFGPNIMLFVRELLIRTEEEEDFIQLQTLMSILINTNIDTLDMLGELARFSRIHKDMFLYAYQGYPSNPDLELARLQSKTSLVDFKRFIGKLKLSVADLSLKEAYSDLLVERDHILRLRDMSLTESIDRKRSICGPISMTPLALLILGQFLIPIGILGYSEFMSALGSLTLS